MPYSAIAYWGGSGRLVDHIVWSRPFAGVIRTSWLSMHRERYGNVAQLCHVLQYVADSKGTDDLDLDYVGPLAL